MLQTLHAKLKLKGLDDDQKVFYQSAIYAYEVNYHLLELMLVTGYILGAHASLNVYVVTVFTPVGGTVVN